MSENYEETEYYTDGDNSDDWTDMKTMGADGEVGDVGTLDEYSWDVLSDLVGYGDSVDYAAFTLDSASTLSFSINATGAVKFTIYQLIQNKNGSYSLKALQTTTLSYDKYFEDYEAVTKGLLLQAGTYYFSVTSTNADKGGSAYYDVSVEVNASEEDADSDPLGFDETVTGGGCDLSMPETDILAMTDSLNLTNVLSFGQCCADVLANASAASSLAEPDGKAGWLNCTTLA